jgi:hypothetical protein
MIQKQFKSSTFLDEYHANYQAALEKRYESERAVNLDTSLPFEEHTEMLAQAAIAFLGPMGRVVVGAEMQNHFILVEGHPPIWYGDLSIDDLPKMRKLAGKYGERIHVTPEQHKSETDLYWYANIQFEGNLLTKNRFGMADV